MFANFDPKKVSVTDSLIEFLLKYSLEGLQQCIEKDEKFLTYHMMKTHLKNFQNKRKDSSDFKNAVEVFQSLYNPDNFKNIDL